MKNSELYVMRDGLNAVPDELSYQNEKKKGIIKFKLAISKNKRMLKNHLKDVEEPIKPSEEYKKYAEDEQELSKKFCCRDKDGKNIIISDESGIMGDRYDIIGKDDPESEYSLEFKKLKDKFKKEIGEQKEKTEKFSDFLEEESDYEPYFIPLELVPEDIPQSAMDGVLFIIEEEKDSKKKKK